MTFNREQYLESLDRPKFVADGVEYVGAILSFAEFNGYREALVAMTFDMTAASVEAWRAFFRRFADHVFPPPPAPAESVADMVLALPFAGQMAAFTDFFGSLARIIVGSATTTESQATADLPTTT